MSMGVSNPKIWKMQFWFSLTIFWDFYGMLGLLKVIRPRSFFEFAKIVHQCCEPDAAAALLSNSVVWPFRDRRKAQIRFTPAGFPAGLQRDLLPLPSFYRSRSLKALKKCLLLRAKPMSTHREGLHRLFDQSVFTDVAMCSHMLVLKHNQVLGSSTEIEKVRKCKDSLKARQCLGAERV